MWILYLHISEEESLKTKKTNFSWVYPLPVATSQVIQLFLIKIKLVLLAVGKMGEID